MKIMKFVIPMAFVLLIAGCGLQTEEMENIMDSDNIETTCLNGVTYYHFAVNQTSGYKGYGFMAPAYNPDGTLITCNLR